jgi:hypothetical protein
VDGQPRAMNRGNCNSWLGNIEIKIFATYLMREQIIGAGHENWRYFSEIHSPQVSENCFKVISAALISCPLGN